MKIWRASGVLVLAIASVSIGAADEPLTNADIVRLTQAGLDWWVIAAKIESSATAFDTSEDALIALGEKGVGVGVIQQMVEFGTETTPCADGSAGRQTPQSASGTTTSRVALPSGDSAAASVPPAQPKAILRSTFREPLRSGGKGPEMVVIPAGSFRMGCLLKPPRCGLKETPVRTVTIPQAFAVSKCEVTHADYFRFAHKGTVVDPRRRSGWLPAGQVSWNDSKDYVDWLSSETGASYRLLSEAEWEYAARAGSTTRYNWGNAIGTNRANCVEWGCGDRWDTRAPAGSFAANAFGLYDMHGNVWEWVEDCWYSYEGAPSDGSAWTSGDCEARVLRGGSWDSGPGGLRSANRLTLTPGTSGNFIGIRVARSLRPGRNAGSRSMEER